MGQPLNGILLNFPEENNAIGAKPGHGWTEYSADVIFLMLHNVEAIVESGPGRVATYVLDQGIPLPDLPFPIGEVLVGFVFWAGCDEQFCTFQLEAVYVLAEIFESTVRAILALARQYVWVGDDNFLCMTSVAMNPPDKVEKTMQWFFLVWPTPYCH